MLRRLSAHYDPEIATTVHFVLFGSGKPYSRHGVFPSLCGREVLYTTGNHTVAPKHVRELVAYFDMVLAPSQHVLRPYLQAGLSPRRGGIVPHGIEPAVFWPEAPPFQYPTRKTFKFLQTSFPWVTEKGFDLSVKAFGQAFSSRDDVALVLRVPRVMEPARRAQTYGRLDGLVKEELARPGAPEILLLEMDLEPDQRARIYTGADCYVHPLRAEGFGMTILEAMACGMPVIATPWSGPADFLSPRWARILQHSGPFPERSRGRWVARYHVEPNLDDLIQQMRVAFGDRVASRELGLRAARVARERWTWVVAARKLASLLGYGSERRLRLQGRSPATMLGVESEVHA